MRRKRGGRPREGSRALVVEALKKTASGLHQLEVQLKEHPIHRQWVVERLCDAGRLSEEECQEMLDVLTQVGNLASSLSCAVDPARAPALRALPVQSSQKLPLPDAGRIGKLAALVATPPGTTSNDLARHILRGMGTAIGALELKKSEGV
jgi:hypothetical protein